MSEVRVWTSREAVQVAFGGYDELRDEIRRRAHGAFGDDQRPVRAALLEVVFLLDRWEADMVARFGVEGPAVPVRLELVDPEFPRGSEPQLNRAWANLGRFGRHMRRAS